MKIDELILEKKCTLGKVVFEPNSYADFRGNANFKMVDEVEFGKVLVNGFTVSVSRVMESDERKMFKVFVSYDIFIKIKESDVLISEDDMKEYVADNKIALANLCMAKISLMISQITSQITNGVPLISSPNFIA